MHGGLWPEGLSALWWARMDGDAGLERIPLDVNQKSYTGFPWARKSDSYAPDGRSGGSDGEGILQGP
jgi:hypothetical protein